MRIDGFGQLEATIMNRMWSRDPSAAVTVRDVLVELSAERDIAYTTVMSTMDNLHTKGWLTRKRQGKAYDYWVALTREEYTARMMHNALDGGGSSELVLTHFVEQMSPEESAGLRAALRRLANRAATQ